MAEVPHAKSIEEPSLDLGGYRQELKRTLGSFQVFAISFAFISVAVGVFGTYDDVRIKPDVGSDAGWFACSFVDTHRDDNNREGRAPCRPWC